MPIFFKKAISLWLIILIVATIGSFTFFKPKPAQAVFPVTDWYEDFTRPLIVSVLRTIYLSAIRPQLADIIAGRSDRPVYVANPSEYIRDIFTDEVAKQIEEIAQINVCEGFKDPLKKAIKVNFSRLPYEEPPAPECTAKEAWENIKNRKPTLDDFAKIAEPQNNFFGAYLLASDTMSRKTTEKTREATTELVTGQGFIGVKSKRTRDGKEEEYIKTPGAAVFQRVTKSDLTPQEIINNSKDLASLLTGITYDLITVVTGGMTERLLRSSMNYYESKGH